MKPTGTPPLSSVTDERLKKERSWLLLLLILYLFVTLAYGAITPLFEAPDEQLHYYTAQLIADTGKLPFVPSHADYDEWISQEAAQPPLYYLLGAALIAPIDSSNARNDIWLNKYRNIGDAGALNNRNHFIHTISEEWPWQGYSLAVHILRVFSTALGFGTLLCIYASGRLLWPADSYPVLLAVGLVAFLPQFDFLFASASNDTLIIFLCAAAIWQLIRLWLTGVTRIRMLLLGITVGLAMLTKNAGTILLAYSVGVILLLAMRGITIEKDQDLIQTDQQDSDLAVTSGWPLVRMMVLYLMLPAILIGGWLWVRNYVLYEDITAINQFLRFSGGDRGYSILQVLGESGGLWLSIIAIFGWFNLRPPDWVYWFWNGVILLAFAGAVWHGIHQRRNIVLPAGARESGQSWRKEIPRLLQGKWVLLLLLAGWVLILYISLFSFMLKTEAAQGRLLFPALIPLALGLAYGWTANAGFRRFSAILPPISFLITLYCLLFVIRPVYAFPDTIEKLPVEVRDIDIQIGEGLSLLGGEVKTEKAKPGDPVWLTLYWQVDSVPEEPVAFTVSIFGRDLVEIAKLHSYHGRGLYPANLWSSGEIVADHFAVRLKEDIEAPILGKIWAGIEAGQAGAEVGEVKIVPASWAEYSEPAAAQIDDVIDLSGVEIGSNQVSAGDMVDLKVIWQVRRDLSRDLTTLVHIGQPDQPPLAVGDRPPMNGSYPTRIWSAGEVIEDGYSLRIPDRISPGRYPLWIGMYDSKTQIRLPLSVGGERQPRDVYLAGWLEIGE